MRNQEKQHRLYEKLKRELGDKVLAALEDEDVTEIMLNPDGRLWVEDRKSGMRFTGELFDPVHAYNLIGTVASLKKTVINESKPILETELPLDGSRFEALIPGIVTAPSFCIRKHAKKIFTLADYVHAGTLDKRQWDTINELIDSRKTILIVGGPGCGKTTLANAILNEMIIRGDVNQRFVILEDTRELQYTAKNVVSMKTTQHANYAMLLRASLRSRPDRICMGECRGAETLILLKAWNTGTPGGLATLHANSAQAALVRISEMVEEAGVVAQAGLICESINYIIPIQFDHIKGRRVNNILRVTGFENNQYQFDSV